MKLGLASSCPGLLDSSSTSSGSPFTDLPIWVSLAMLLQREANSRMCANSAVLLK